MKKHLSLFAVVILALSLSSCGDNKTKQKIIGVSSIDKTTGGSTSAAAAPTVQPTQTLTNTKVAINDSSKQVTTMLTSIQNNRAPSVPAAPTNLAAPARLSVMKGAQVEDQFLAFSSDTTTGWYTYTYSSDAYWNYTMRFHLSDSAGKTITPLYIDYWYEADFTTKLPIKKYEFEYSGFWDADGYRGANSLTTTELNPLKRCTYTGSYTMVYVTPGDFTAGVTTNGSYRTIMTYKDGATQTYNTVLTNLSSAYTNGIFKYTGGSYSMTYYDWEYYIAFSANGNGSGYCKGPGYNYRITVDGTTGDWTFTAQ